LYNFSTKKGIFYNNIINAGSPSNFPLVLRQGSSKATQPSSADDVSQHLAALGRL
tara:strand:- start:5528 stop:5692 length:165 start_codon:yes stop_codon:yes gene_type:complete